MIAFVSLVSLAAAALVWSFNPRIPKIAPMKKLKKEEDAASSTSQFSMPWPYAAAALAVFVLMTLAGWWGPGIAAAAGVIATPSLRSVKKDNKEARLVAAGVAAWIEQVRSLVAAGQALGDALSEASQNVVSLVPMQSFANNAEAFGTSRALQFLSRGLSNPMADMAIVALMLAEQEGGGRLRDVLDDVASHIRENMQLEEDAESARSGLRIERWVAFTAGLVVTIGCILMAGLLDHFRDAVGQMVMLGTFGVIGAAMWWMIRLERFRTPAQFILKEE